MLGLINLFVLFSSPFNATVAIVIDKVTTDFKYLSEDNDGQHFHTGKCIRRFAGIYAYCRYFIDQKW